MDIKPIRTEEDYRATLQEIDLLMTAAFGTPEGDRLDVLTKLVEVWERKHTSLNFRDPDYNSDSPTILSGFRSTPPHRRPI